jgi:7-keto-8-aminopelargonate synthetase-like enzyme
MSSHKKRLEALEAQRHTGTRRVIVLSDGVYSEGGQVISEAEYKAIASDTERDVLLIEIVRAESKTNQPGEE